MSPTTNWRALVEDVRHCSHCPDLPLGPKPIFQLHPDAKILIVGQAPGRRTHHQGRPFDDPSGDRLRHWLGVDKDTFYNEQLFSMLPMGFCYPGTGKGGDLPPRPECAPQWRAPLLASLPNIQLTLVIGQYAHAWHLNTSKGTRLTDTVNRWQDYWPTRLPLPHPSPRNIRWLKQNPWFTTDILPVLQQRVQQLLTD